MKPKLKSIMIIIFFLLILLSFLFLPKDTINSVLLGLNIWLYNVFPSLFPFFIISELLINYGFNDFLSEFFRNFMSLFGLSGNASFAFLGSIFSGFPSGSKYTRQLLDNNIISDDEANHLIRFTHFSNPLFIIGTIGILLNNIFVSYLILISHYLGNIIIGICFRKKKIKNKYKVSFKKAINLMHNKRINNKNNFITILTDAIYKTIDILILLLGTIIIFLILSNLITLLPVNDNLILFSKGILEMTQGIKFVSNSSLSLLIKTILVTFFISFGGLTVHLQVSSIISNSKIKYKNFLIARMFHSFISIILVYILFNIFIN